MNTSPRIVTHILKWCTPTLELIWVGLQNSGFQRTVRPFVTPALTKCSAFLKPAAVRRWCGGPNDSAVRCALMWEATLCFGLQLSSRGRGYCLSKSPAHTNSHATPLSAPDQQKRIATTNVNGENIHRNKSGQILHALYKNISKC